MSPARLDARHLGRLAALLLLAAVASVAWPLATYTLTLALFGVAHVLAELRYVDRRFGPRLGTALARGLGAALLLVVLARGLVIAGLGSGGLAAVLELAAGVGLVGLVLPRLCSAGRGIGSLGLLVAAGLGVAIACSPAAGLLAVAVLHNLTPVGFVLEATAAGTRRRAAWACAVVFAAVPLLLASGAPWAVASSLGITAPEASPLGYGPLEQAMRAYLPVPRLAPATALHLFTACVFLQCAHYVAVLGVMPRLLPPGATGRLRWPDGRAWTGLLAATSLGVLAFAWDFAQARQGYGMLAAVHAWIELPLLLLALVPVTAVAKGRSRTTPRSSPG